MIKLILGEAGSGKTKQILEMANQDVETAKGEIAFLEPTSKHLHQLHRDIRLISTEEFQIDTRNSVYGLLCGLLSANYDIEKIYIDSLDKMIGSIDSNIIDFVEMVDELANDRDIEVIIACNIEDPEILKSLEKFSN
ncbi:MAG: hypothetical protein Q3993_05670 [Filifactor alocis]|nr:hypothetical protein [Filifactor alocis]